ncbi:hypothetical protein ACIQXG_20485 [Lysinibacillus sphaericus]|uniref:hypothetical protein n=1 Tax=Lysinibacillus sphaericus TaxID=1421 RepID=UPI00380A442C
MVLLTPISTGVIAFEAGPNIAANPNCCGSTTANYAGRIVTGDGALPLEQLLQLCMCFLNNIECATSYGCGFYFV